ncbi:MAG: signal transduction histidine kinase [Candidatus Azotimanducaceae bacterium]
MKILIIEDNPDHLELIEDMLYAMPEHDVKVSSEVTLGDGIDKLVLEHFDVCLCDLQLPDSSIEKTVEWLSTTSIGIPIITLTSLNNSDIAKELLGKGVQDYVSKEELSPELLARSCRYAIERWKHQLRINEHHKDLQAFCSILSHDFNGHINRITGVADVIKSDFEKRFVFTEKDNKWFEFLNTSTTAIHQLVSSLQQYLSIEYTAKTFSSIPLLQIVKSTESFILTSTKKTFTLKYSDDMPIVSGNASLLQLMLQNLISNGIKFCEHKPSITINCIDLGDVVIVAIKDNGIGFDVTKSDVMFRPFNRLANGYEYGGSGLGLSIVHRIVEHHEGSIEVDSSLGAGSTFTIALPKATEL